MNQCYVVASDSQNDECSKMSGIITPQGEVYRNGTENTLSIEYKPKQIALMRRYMDVGISFA
jgi:predicted amidohydrolase